MHFMLLRQLCSNSSHLKVDRIAKYRLGLAEKYVLLSYLSFIKYPVYYHGFCLWGYGNSHAVFGDVSRRLDGKLYELHFLVFLLLRNRDIQWNILYRLFEMYFFCLINVIIDFLQFRKHINDHDLNSFSCGCHWLDPNLFAWEFEGYRDLWYHAILLDWSYWLSVFCAPSIPFSANI